MKTAKTARNKEVARATTTMTKCETARLTELEGTIDSALANLKAGLTTLRSAKSQICSACVEGRTDKGKCRYYKGHSYLPVYQANQIPAEARL